VAKLPANVLASLVGVWHPDNFTPLLLGTVASSSAGYLDRDIERAIASPGSRFGTVAETGGGPVASGAFVLGLFALGRVGARHERFRAATYDMLDASVVNLAYTELLKKTIHRVRPNGEDRQSFPSGLERHYGWKVSLPAYLVAGAVGVSRLQRNKHHLSDVAAGAALGYLVGRTVARVNGRPTEVGPQRGAQLRLQPLVGPEARGLVVSLAF
jgi:membrane-associated phospholipid phosphatase